jgi:hypothetical protein
MNDKKIIGMVSNMQRVFLFETHVLLLFCILVHFLSDLILWSASQDRYNRITILNEMSLWIVFLYKYHSEDATICHVQADRLHAQSDIYITELNFP